MIGSSIAVTFNAVAKTLPLISEGNYSSEYLLKEASEEFRVKIRHSKETQKTGQQAFDRHYVELTHFVYPTVALPLGQTTQVYTIVRTSPNFDGTEAVNSVKAHAGVISRTDYAPKIVNWES